MLYRRWGLFVQNAYVLDSEGGGYAQVVNADSIVSIYGGNVKGGAAGLAILLTWVRSDFVLQPNLQFINETRISLIISSA